MYGRDEPVQKACEFILDHSQDLDSGSCSISAAVQTWGGRHSEVLPCSTKNMVFSLIRLGYLDDPRAAAGYRADQHGTSASMTATA